MLTFLEQVQVSAAHHLHVYYCENEAEIPVGSDEGQDVGLLIQGRRSRIFGATTRGSALQP